MRHLLTFLYLLIVLTSCENAKQAVSPHSELRAQLQQAEEMRFSRPECSDSILNHSLEELKVVNNDELWAQYYFVKAHVEESKSNFVEVSLLLDSAVNHGLYNDKAYEVRVILLEAIINEQLLLFKEASALFNSLCEMKEDCALTPHEQLMVYLGKARIAKRLRLPFADHLAKAEDIVSQNTNIDLGIFFSNKAFLSSDSDKKIEYSKRALDYYIKKEMPLKIYNCYYNMAFHYVDINIDSSLHYIHKAQVLNLDSSLVDIITNSRQQCYFYYNYAIILFHHGDNEQALDYIRLALPIAESLGLENALYGLKSIKADILFIQGYYLASKSIAEEASDHYYTYKLKASENQIKYLEAKTHIEEVLTDNRISHLKLNNKTLSNRLYLLFSFILVCLIIVLIFHAKRIKGHLVKSYERIYKKDVSIFELENKISIVNGHLNMKVHPEKVILSQINKELKDKATISSWDTFFLMYTHKHPECYERFQNLFPHLKPMELQFALCVHYGLSDEMTAHLFKVKKASIRKKRQRLRQILDLSPDADIKEHLSHALTKRPYKH
jgi:tetratricopeptide (TPR) repeat protein